jgi:hypothetical protein
MNHHANGKAPTGDFGLHHDAWGRLVLTDAHGRTHPGIEPVRAFPISDPRHGIALCDAEARELVWVEDLDALPPAVCQMLEEDLARRQFVPTLHRIVKVTGTVEPVEWEVETDRGTTRFSVKSEEDVRRLAGHRALVTDAHGIRYLIPDVRALDFLSRRTLERYL